MRRRVAIKKFAVEFKSNERCIADKSCFPDIMGEKEKEYNFDRDQFVWSMETNLRASGSRCQYDG